MAVDVQKELAIVVKLSGDKEATAGLQAVAAGAKQAASANDQLKKSTESASLTYRQMYGIAQAEMAVRNQQRQRILDHASALEIDRQRTEAANAAERKMVLLHAEAIEMNNQLAASGQRAALGVQALRGPLTAITAKALETNPAIATLVSTLGGVTATGPVVVGVLAGIGAVAAAYHFLTAATREAAAEQQKFLDQAKQTAQQRQYGAIGDMAHQWNAAAVEAKRAADAVKEAQDALAKATTGTAGGFAGGKIGGATAPDVAALRRNVEDLSAEAQEAQARVNLLTQAIIELQTGITPDKQQELWKETAEAAVSAAEAVRQYHREIQILRNMGVQSTQTGDTGILNALGVQYAAPGVTLPTPTVAKIPVEETREFADSLSDAVAAAVQLGRAFDGIGDSVARIGGGIAQIIGGFRALGSATGKLDQLTATLPILGGFASVVTGFMDAAKEHQEAIRQFNEAQENFVNGLRRFSNDFDRQLADLDGSYMALAKQSGYSPNDPALRDKPPEWFLTAEAIAAYQRERDRILQEKQLAVLQDQLDAEQKMVDSLQQTVDALKSYSDSLKLSNLSTLSPGQQYTEAKRQYDEIAARAANGDQAAARQLPGVANTFLQFARSYYGSSSQYARDYQQVQGFVDAMTDKYGAQLDVEESILAELQRQTALMQNQIDLGTNGPPGSSDSSTPSSGLPGGRLSPNSAASRSVSAISDAGIDRLEAVLLRVERTIARGNDMAISLSRRN